MRLFLSSAGLGDQPADLARLAGTGTRAAVLAHASDDLGPTVQRQVIAGQVAALDRIGIPAEPVDLRACAGPDQAAARLDPFGLVWVPGGNVFLLRAVLARSGADQVLADRVRDGRLTYAGGSAGACVLSPSLRGFELVDDPSVVPAVLGTPADWTGLGLLDFAFVPHVGSPLPELAGVTALIARFERDRVPYRAVRDGAVLLVDEPA